MSRRALALEVALYSVSKELVPQNNTFLELASSQSEVSRLLNEHSRTLEFAGVDCRSTLKVRTSLLWLSVQCKGGVRMDCSGEGVCSANSEQGGWKRRFH